jgi:hypothetical protein
MNEHLKGSSFLEQHRLSAAKGSTHRDIMGRKSINHQPPLINHQSATINHPSTNRNLESGRHFNHGHGQNPYEPRKATLEILGCSAFGSSPSLGSLPSQAAFLFNGRTRRDSKVLRAVPRESWQGL